MGHRLNLLVQRSLVPCLVVAMMVLLHLGYSAWRTAAILLPIFGVLMLAMIFMDPGPRAKGFVEGLKSHFR